MSENLHTQNLQTAKRVVLDYYEALDGARQGEIAKVLAQHTAEDYRWRGMHPFNEISSADEVAERFHMPLRASFAPLQRRPDIFLAGFNTEGEEGEVWVCQMGNLLGLFDRAWMDIPPTRKMCFIRYAEFHRVDGDRIAETAFFTDVISVMRQAGCYPLPPQTGSSHIYPGPRTHDGLLFGTRDPSEGTATMALVDEMIADLLHGNEVGNETGQNIMPRSVLARCWHEDMIWAGPEGIGASYTIDRYQQQHQHPFRTNLFDKTFNGHVARLAEGNYACFFGWPNLTVTADGGFCGLPGSDVPADMRVVDVYRRDGDKLAENWVFIDMLNWLNMQGLDALARMRQLLGVEEFRAENIIESDWERPDGPTPSDERESREREDVHSNA
ncbi:MAG: hypothetical protein OXB92_13420 [Acidimicrobiaceae bacterium]|nr:hypothetical protein [Acidimicrobiaceae bacterium]